jgi:hypothetical protein
LRERVGRKLWENAEADCAQGVHRKCRKAVAGGIHFAPKSKREKYGEYREAWRLLRETGLTIQAGVDEKWSEVRAGTADSSLHSE